MRGMIWMVLIAVAAFSLGAFAQDSVPAGKAIMKLEKDARVYAAQISPDGKLLVYQKIDRQAATEPTVSGAGKPVYRLVLRELESGKETLLPSAAMASDDPIQILLKGGIFSKDSGKITFFVSDDANGNGLYDKETEKLQAGVYDVASGKLTKVGPIDEIILPVFDGRGTGLVITAGTEKGPWKVYVVPALDRPAKALDVSGVAIAVQPDGDLVAVVGVTGKEAKGGATLSLVDPAKGTAVRLPMDPENESWDRYPPRFSNDGKYLCWNERGPENGPRNIMHIWDVQAGKELTAMPDMLALGPYENGMIVGKGRRDIAYLELPEGQPTLLHLPQISGFRPLLSRDKILWTDRNELGESTFRMIDIAALMGK